MYVITKSKNSLPYACPDVSARDALKKLKSGNAKRKKALPAEEGQCPYAIILSCADSRIIPEKLFNAKAGDLFVLRVAGNVTNPDITASIEFAVSSFNTKLIVVLGHQECGAVSSAISITNKPYEENVASSNLNLLLAKVRPAVVALKECSNLRKVIDKNAELNGKLLFEQSGIIKNAGNKGLEIWSAYARFDGEVEFNKRIKLS